MSPARPSSALGMALALLLGLPTLSYHFSRDQALFETIGRSWLNGELPYVDNWDQKPPAIHAVYALGALVAGGNAEWPIRVFDLALMMATGVLIAHLARSEGEEPAVSAGAATLFGTGLLVLNFAWWDLGQVETWEAACSLLCYAIARRARGAAGLMAAGAVGALAVLFKLTAAPMLAVVGLRVIWDRRAQPAQAARGLGAASVGGLIGLLIGVSPWILTHSFPTFWEMVITYNLAYAAQAGRHVTTFGEWAVRVWPWLLATLGLVGATLRRMLRDDHVWTTHGPTLAWSVLLAFGALASVVMQPNNFGYHWTVVLPFLTWTAAAAANAVLDPKRPGLAVGGAAAVALIGFVASPIWPNTDGWHYRRYVLQQGKILLGLDPPETIHDAYRTRRALKSFDWEEVAIVAGAIRLRARPGDTMCSTGYEAGLYTLSGLDCPARFSTEYSFDEQDWDYKDEEWKAELHEELRAEPPTFYVTRKKDRTDRKRMSEQGYAPTMAYGRFIVLQRLGG